MSALRDAKVEKVAEIKEKLQNASSFVLVFVDWFSILPVF